MEGTSILMCCCIFDPVFWLFDPVLCIDELLELQLLMMVFVEI